MPSSGILDLPEDKGMRVFLCADYAVRPWGGQGFLDGKMSLVRQRLALGHTGRLANR